MTGDGRGAPGSRPPRSTPTGPRRSVHVFHTAKAPADPNDPEQSKRPDVAFMPTLMATLTAPARVGGKPAGRVLVVRVGARGCSVPPLLVNPAAGKVEPVAAALDLSGDQPAGAGIVRRPRGAGSTGSSSDTPGMGR